MEYIKAEQQGSTLILTINRPHCMNALNNGVYEEIIACLEDAKELMPYALAMAEKIGSKASYAVSLAKSAIYTSQSTDLPNGCLRERNLLGLVFATHDKQEGMEAFLARRKPEFKDF
ncbi:MAG: enoyl-CoA hydratase-related protein [Evtepia sp.]|uniref:enoyl-CoA hydratase-related protein n=1 Tax=Evtepia sp. TaxID=2773933 RepID=UPI002A74B421|nr:enoyl-CoA hydratase-related protein [Evtepia sp.]MDY3014104.1 enoyl-CoA hydratase-related protein [Evtepia sp.]